MDIEQFDITMEHHLQTVVLSPQIDVSIHISYDVLLKQNLGQVQPCFVSFKLSVNNHKLNANYSLQV